MFTGQKVVSGIEGLCRDLENISNDVRCSRWNYGKSALRASHHVADVVHDAVTSHGCHDVDAICNGLASVPDGVFAAGRPIGIYVISLLENSYNISMESSRKARSAGVGEKCEGGHCFLGYAV